MFDTVYGVDFSGARSAGRTIWVARIEAARGRRKQLPYSLAELARLEDLCGTAERSAALAHLVTLIADSRDALWALAAVVVLAAGAILGQSLARQTHQVSTEFPILRAVGMSGVQLFGLGVLRAAVVGALAGATGVVLAFLLSPMAPIGLARLAEPDPRDVAWRIVEEDPTSRGRLREDKVRLG